MPKERRERSVSFDRSRASPFPSSSSHPKWSSCINSSETAEDVKEWEDARCPVCMEHPHNAILLVCSSYDKGCRPYMCDTSYRHSNCLDQFCKAFSETPSAQMLQESTILSDVTHPAQEQQHTPLNQDSDGHAPQPAPNVGQEQSKLLCPLCRGKIKDWIVVEPARQFMNAKVRSCAREACMFSGTYYEIRKHARLEHPLVRPSEADPERQRDWRRLERQRDLGDVLSTFQSVFNEDRVEGGRMSFSEDRVEEGHISFDEGSLLTVLLLIRVLPQDSSINWSVPSRFRGLSRSRRRGSLWGEMYDGEPSTSTRGEDDGSEDVSGIWYHRDRGQ
ncbi:uncharacterized protein LOC131255896 [Magnolia sinica]|uniref:uncharacterized protein LOC131255896 n=1 Tax=Magnolia sinica TaxID=86752 RepID=UPI002658829C|nr:uncharacterized protein LOC131255896 [Magnolia sinica]XP_058112815.1 uncharacterized protein LOC131255896 [Magnolia sinica]XP_058112825.1 uncharacterized protein LOC131255896 [Magnolia sinica]